MASLLLPNGTLTRRRYSGSFEDHRWSKGTATETTVAAHVEPTTYGQNEQMRVDGNRSSHYIEIFAPIDFDLRGVDQYGEDAADEVTHTKYPGVYRVVQVDKFDDFEALDELSHINAIAVRVGDRTW